MNPELPIFYPVPSGTDKKLKMKRHDSTVLSLGVLCCAWARLPAQYFLHFGQRPRRMPVTVEQPAPTTPRRAVRGVGMTCPGTEAA